MDGQFPAPIVRASCGVQIVLALLAHRCVANCASPPAA
jgi:hypothetical protein